MSLTLEMPLEVETRMRENVPNLEREAITAIALDLFRKEKITHFELGQLLGLNRFDTDAFLIHLDEYAQCLTPGDLECDYQTLTGIMRKHRP